MAFKIRDAASYNAARAREEESLNSADGTRRLSPKGKMPPQIRLSGLSANRQMGHSEWDLEDGSLMLIDYLEPADIRWLPGQNPRFPKFGHLRGGVCSHRVDVRQIRAYEVWDRPIRGADVEVVSHFSYP